MTIRFYGYILIFKIILLLTWNAVAFPAPRKFKRPPFCDDKQDEEALSFLWSTKREPPSYFFGTIHVPYTRVWDHIPDNAKQAFEASDNIVFELDLMDPSTISALASCQMLPQGKNLVDVLPDDMFRRLKRHLDYVKVMMASWMTADQRGQGLYADYLFNAITGNWERKRPIWVMLMVNSLTESDVRSRGIPVLDLYLAQEAGRMNKRTDAVERVEEQCVPLNGLNFSQVLFALNQTLFQHESIRTGDLRATYTTDDLIKHYNCGDLNAVIFSRDTTQVPNLVNSTLTPHDLELARNIDDYFRQELIYKRNKRMGDRVVQFLRDHPDQSFFFAFGAGHFLGNDTVLDFVREKGFEIEHVAATRKIRTGKKSEQRSSRPSWGFKAEILPPGNNNLGDLSAASEEDVTEDDQTPTGQPSSGRREPSWKKRGKKKNPIHRSPAIHLVRTTPTPATSKPRKFNDLWVRLDGYTTWSPRTYSLPQNPTSDDMLSIQNSLRVWYGYQNASAGSCSLRSNLLFGVILLFWTWNLLSVLVYKLPP